MVSAQIARGICNLFANLFLPSPSLLRNATSPEGRGLIHLIFTQYELPLWWEDFPRPGEDVAQATERGNGERMRD